MKIIYWRSHNLRLLTWNMIEKSIGEIYKNVSSSISFSKNSCFWDGWRFEFFTLWIIALKSYVGQSKTIQSFTYRAKVHSSITHILKFVLRIAYKQKNQQKNSFKREISDFHVLIDCMRLPFEHFIIAFTKYL